MGVLGLILCIGLATFLIVFVIRIPIMVAKKRGLKKSDINVITLLSWVSLLAGITWFVALIMSFVYQPPQDSIKKQSSPDDLDELSKLFELKEKGLLSQEEFEKAKGRLL